MWCSSLTRGTDLHGPNWRWRRHSHAPRGEKAQPVRCKATAGWGRLPAKHTGPNPCAPVTEPGPDGCGTRGCGQRRPRGRPRSCAVGVANVIASSTRGRTASSWARFIGVRSQHPRTASVSERVEVRPVADFPSEATTSRCPGDHGRSVRRARPSVGTGPTHPGRFPWRSEYVEREAAPRSTSFVGLV